MVTFFLPVCVRRLTFGGGVLYSGCTAVPSTFHKAPGGVVARREPLSFHATQKRRAVVVFVNLSTSSGAAAFRALLSSLDEVTDFQVILYSPARSSSESPMWALI